MSATRAIPKGYKLATVQIDPHDFVGSSPQHVGAELCRLSEHLINPIITFDYYGDVFTIEGVVPMTDAEKRRAEKRREAAKKSARARAERVQRAEMEQLKALTIKYAGKVLNP